AAREDRQRAAARSGGALRRVRRRRPSRPDQPVARLLLGVRQRLAPADRRTASGRERADGGGRGVAGPRLGARPSERVLRLGRRRRARRQGPRLRRGLRQPELRGRAFQLLGALPQTGVLLKAPGSLLPSLRANKFEGQASYVNPGLLLFGAGLDLQLTPKLRASLNANYLRFHQTGSLSFLLFQPGIRKDVGVDLGGGLLYRPLLSENIVVLAGFAGLFLRKGFAHPHPFTLG